MATINRQKLLTTEKLETAFKMFDTVIIPINFLIFNKFSMLFKFIYFIIIIKDGNGK